MVISIVPVLPIYFIIYKCLKSIFENISMWALDKYMLVILNGLFLRDESNDVQIKAISLLVMILAFGPIFAPRPHMGKIVRMDPKPP